MMPMEVTTIAAATSRLYYYDDTTLSEFDASVLGVRELVGEDGVPRIAVRLDRTAFYPTSGGQPHDTGSLGEVRVVEVVEDPADTRVIWHLLAEPEPTLGSRVRGRIDWARRFDHMQQHTGQHLLSTAFEDALSAPTVGFHLGSTSSTIDLEISGRSEGDRHPTLTWEMAFEIEAAVNAVVWQNRPVVVRIVDAEEIASIPLRKPPVVTGKVRVVWVEAYDASACGGTHVGATGEIGIIKITGIEHYKGGVRVSFVCGGRALKAYQASLHTLQRASLALSVGPDDLLAAITRLEDDTKLLRRDVRRLRETVLDDEAEALWVGASVVDGTRAIASHWDGRDFADVRALAGRLRERPGVLLLFAVTEGGAVRVLVARSDDLDTLHAGAILRALLDGLGGRGGGSATMAQGGTAYHPPEVILAALQDALSSLRLRVDVDGYHRQSVWRHR